ncbi:hypothetical protein CEXT_583661 [Caerostris extrusa]|uniref:Uncharacterized protein n=1 Tax=Caerostris extrusa TaxID=172846 RepID=A0AAV4XPI9_CAEEX|nr:hypothetical protein CEXT_583661 [Caerostris extrusa]
MGRFFGGGRVYERGGKRRSLVVVCQEEGKTPPQFFPSCVPRYHFGHPEMKVDNRKIVEQKEFKTEKYIQKKEKWSEGN